MISYPDFFGLKFDDIYHIEQKISEGSFGTVYLGFNSLNSKKVAIKVEKNSFSMFNVLYKEAQILKKLQGLEGIPKLYYFGQKFIYHAMIIELLGKDLLQFYKKSRRFSLKTVCKIAFQLLQILNRIHEKGVVHRDLKPENIVVGLENSPNLLYLIDYGIAKEFIENGKHIPYMEGRPFIGTIRFASLAAHKGIELSRKDDLESLGYLLIFFLKGKLPWQLYEKMSQKQRKETVAKLKENTKTEDLCENLPMAFTTYLKYVKNLSFKEIPNYSYLKGIFSQLADEQKFELQDNLWDWTETISNNPSFLSSKIYETHESFEKKSSSFVIDKNVKESLPHFKILEEKKNVQKDKIEIFKSKVLEM